MGTIEILHDADGAYGYPVGTRLSVEELFRDFKNSDECNDSFYNFLCRIPIPAAVDCIAEKWNLDYKFV